MERGYRYRIYPTDEQKVLMAKTFGCVRFVYNWGLELKTKKWKEEHKNISLNDLSKLVSSQLKVENKWLEEVNSQSLQYSLRQLNTAFENFFNHKCKFPKFKTKYDVQKFHCPQKNYVDFKRGLLKIGKFRKDNAIKCIFHKKFHGRIISVTITLENDGRYYANLIVDDNIKPLPQHNADSNTTIGIDMGLKYFATISTGEKVNTPHFKKRNTKRLAKLQRSLSRKQNKSANFRKAKLKIARLHAKIRHRRIDFIHKLTYRLTHENQVNQICVEHLNIQGMTKNRRLSSSLSDAGIGVFLNQLSYKCLWYGIKLHKINQYAPSSKMCHVCGYINHDIGGFKTLKVREWICPHCGSQLDRDLNAAINIKQIGLLALPTEYGKVMSVEEPTMDDSAKHLKSSAPKKQKKSRNNISEAI